MNKSRILHSVMAGFCAFSMTAGMIGSLGVFAVDTDPITGTITATNVEDGATVKAYKIVTGTYGTADNKTSKLSGFKAIDGVSIADQVNFQPTEAEVAKIVNAISDKTVTLTEYAMNGNKESGYSATVDAGEYIIIVSGSETGSVYNPAVVSVNVTDADTSEVENGSVDFSKNFNDGTKDAYIKKTETRFDKDITKAEDNADTLKNENGDTAAYGDQITYELNEMTIPSYSDAFDAPVYMITDTLEAGKFAGINDLKIYIGKTTNAEGKSTWTELAAETRDQVNYTLTEADGSTAFTAGTSTNFRVSFSSAYLKTLKMIASNDARAVRITYQTALLDTADQNFDENYNHAELEFSNDAKDESSHETIKSNTYHYTFGIDGKADATSEYENYEFNKTANEKGIFTNGVSSKALAGAEFTLYIEADCSKAYQRNNKAYTATSDANGHVHFDGLDEGTYYIQETKAPSGYGVNDHIYRAVIAAELNENGTLKEYTVTMHDMTDPKAEDVVSTYTAGADQTIADDGRVTQTVSGTSAETVVIDTKLSKLPSTGGIGTIGITAAAAAGMTICLLVFEKSKKTASED